MTRYASCQDELIMFSYLCGTVFVASFCMFSGELVSGVVFLHGKVRVEEKRRESRCRVLLTVFYIMLYRLSEMRRPEAECCISLPRFGGPQQAAV